MMYLRNDLKYSLKYINEACLEFSDTMYYLRMLNISLELPCTFSIEMHFIISFFSDEYFQHSSRSNEYSRHSISVLSTYFTSATTQNIP